MLVSQSLKCALCGVTPVLRQALVALEYAVCDACEWIELVTPGWRHRAVSKRRMERRILRTVSLYKLNT